MVSPNCTSNSIARRSASSALFGRGARARRGLGHGDTTTIFDPSAFPELSTYVAKTTPLPPTGTYEGALGGAAVVSEVVNPTTFQTTRTVTYTNYVNGDGLILN
ncbi:hypothetical protein JDV09_14325 [Mycobacterium sp. Y57]|uniref:hypothetical protein n=1 Tax=Mycolicibacterium xanthum TaxID=2796469 RepID=UPI001C84AD96|nr:hypothetical protein [Mycolicibacterium xanthum]MBX7433278.1 hypothetical protein [Mycolicibacterium xanthum]